MRLIDKSTVMDELFAIQSATYMSTCMSVDECRAKRWMIGRAINAVKDAPEIDAVLVVRCKDCKQYNTIGCSKGFGWCESMDRGVSDDFYCANGAKMESDGST
jgi:hypothetical protein